MPAKTVVKKQTSKAPAKRHAKHHKTSKHYLKVYWPYVPIVAILALGFFINTPRESMKSNVLAYATEISNNQLLIETNEERQAHEKQALKINEELSVAAQNKANDMAMKNYWSHYTPTGEAPWVFIDQTGYSYTKAGENLAYGFATSDDTVTGWMNSPTHRDNMLDNAYSEVGFGFAHASDFNGSGNETIVVALYAKPADGATTATLNNDRSLAFTTSSEQEPGSRTVSILQGMSSGSSSWLTFAVGALVGTMLVFVITKHGLAFKRAFVHGEEFVLKHPVLDILFVGCIMVGYFLSQTNGFIR